MNQTMEQTSFWHQARSLPWPFWAANLMEMIETYGTPLRFTYLPLISKKIQQAKLFFQFKSVYLF